MKIRRNDVVLVDGKKMIVLDVQNSKTGLGVFVKDDQGHTHWVRPSDCMTATKAKKRLEYLRGELNAERISYGELSELQDLVPFIDQGDVQLLEAAGVPEFPNNEVAS